MSVHLLRRSINLFYKMVFALLLLLVSGLTMASNESLLEQALIGKSAQSSSQTNKTEQQKEDAEKAPVLTSAPETEENAAEIIALLPEQVLPLQSVQEATLTSIRHLIDEAKESASSVLNYKNWVNWVSAQYKDPRLRDFWQGLMWALVVSLTLAVVVRWLSYVVFRRLYQHWNKPTQWLEVITWYVTDWVCLLLPLVFFMGVSTASLLMFEPDAKVQWIVLTVINAWVVRDFLSILLRRVLTTQATTRYLHWQDATQTSVLKHLSFLGAFLIYGYFGLHVTYYLGLPRFLGELCLCILVICWVILAVRIVLQYKQTVRQATLVYAQKRETNAGRVFWEFFANYWHIVLSAYLIVGLLVWFAFRREGLMFLATATVLSLLIIMLVSAWERGVHYLGRKYGGLLIDLTLHYPILKTRIDRYYRWIKQLLNITVYVAAALLLLEAWHITLWSWLLHGNGQVFSLHIWHAFWILFTAWIVWFICSATIEIYVNNKEAGGNAITLSAKWRTILTLAKNALFITISVIVILSILSELGMNIGPLLAGAGVLGLAVAFGAQRLVQDMITGIFFLLEDTLAVDDTIVAAGVTGKIEALSIRTVRLRDGNGQVHTIPFSGMTMVSNQSRGYAYVTMDLQVGYQTVMEDVLVLIQEVGDKVVSDPLFAEDILEPFQVLGIDSFADSGIIIKTQVKTLPNKQMPIKRAFYQAIKQAFDKAGIEIPYPYRQVIIQHDTKDDPSNK